MTEVLVDDFLEHVGVKGMKWGVRKSRDGGSSGVKKVKKPIGNGDGKVSGDEAKAAAIAGAKIALKYGAPSAAVAVGATVGLPAVAALGVSVRVLQDPGVQDALAVGAKFTKDVMPNIGSIPMPKVPKISNPFGTNVKSSGPSKFNMNYVNGEWPMIRGADGSMVPNPDYVGLKE